MKRSQRSLKAWGEQDWQTKSGKKSSVTGERYLPKKAIQALSAEEYARTTAEKRKAKKKGKQFSSQPKQIAKKTVTKVKNINKPYARKIQILTVLEQRSKYGGKPEQARIAKMAKVFLRKKRNEKVTT